MDMGYSLCPKKKIDLITFRLYPKIFDLIVSQYTTFLFSNTPFSFFNIFISSSFSIFFFVFCAHHTLFLLKSSDTQVHKIKYFRME